MAQTWAVPGLFPNTLMSRFLDKINSRVPIILVSGLSTNDISDNWSGYTAPCILFGLFHIILSVFAGALTPGYDHHQSSPSNNKQKVSQHLEKLNKLDVSVSNWDCIHSDMFFKKEEVFSIAWVILMIKTAHWDINYKFSRSHQWRNESRVIRATVLRSESTTTVSFYCYPCYNVSVFPHSSWQPSLVSRTSLLVHIYKTNWVREHQFLAIEMSLHERLVN